MICSWQSHIAQAVSPPPSPSRRGRGWRISQRFSARVAIEAWHLGGLSRAPDQLATQPTASSFGGIDDGGTLLYHGASLALTVRF